MNNLFIISIQLPINSFSENLDETKMRIDQFFGIIKHCISQFPRSTFFENHGGSALILVNYENFFSSHLDAFNESYNICQKIALEFRTPGIIFKGGLVFCESAPAGLFSLNQPFFHVFF